MTAAAEIAPFRIRLRRLLGAGLVISPLVARAAPFEIEEIKLPPLRILGQPATAHSQGLEIINGTYYVTARREDVTPRRALLLRTAPDKLNWDVWDITPEAAPEATRLLDHPGGMQSDGERLWIPVAESRRNGRSVIRVFPLTALVAGRKPTPEFEFSVNDHIGAFAVAARLRLVLGASWDTETVYVWDLEGRMKQKLTGAALASRGLGTVTDGKGRSGVTVQDWKFDDDRLCASGLFRSPGSSVTSPASRWLSFDRFLEPDCKPQVATVPRLGTTELAREGMAISAGVIHFLPNDLGASNRIYRVPQFELLMRGGVR